MFESLSAVQKQIALEKKGKFVVRACPGSGKTFSVAARVSSLINSWEKVSEGIAAISFTNVAWQEIKKSAETKFECKDLRYPHFIGTIDSFVNNYIFLPFGHLVMGCKARPVLVGEPHGEWNYKRYANDYDQYFDKVGLDIDDTLVYPEIQGLFHFGYSKFYNQDGEESGHARNIREIKNKYWELGYASQHDANYFAYHLLKKYPLIGESVVRRFPVFIIDEAQDTNNLHMGIINLLTEYGLKDLMLVGDPDQAIYEWNNAKPELFKGKEIEWEENSLVMNENRRSSQNICDFTYNLSSLPDVSEAVGETAIFPSTPTVEEYATENVQQVIERFINDCIANGIEVTPENVAIAFRSNSFMDTIFGELVQPTSPWQDNDFVTKDIVRAKYLFSRGELKQGFGLLEKGLLKIRLNKAMVSVSDRTDYIESVGFLNHRTEVISYLNKLPAIDNSLGKWLNDANAILAEIIENPNLRCLPEGNNLIVSNLFKPIDRNSEQFQNVRFGTVHSMKGETFEAMLLFLRTKDGSNYSTYIKDNIKLEDCEALRIVYVGITRPRKLLWIGVPNAKELAAWNSKLNPPTKAEPVL